MLCSWRQVRQALSYTAKAQEDGIRQKFRPQQRRSKRDNHASLSVQPHQLADRETPEPTSHTEILRDDSQVTSIFRAKRPTGIRQEDLVDFVIMIGEYSFIAY